MIFTIDIKEIDGKEPNQNLKVHRIVEGCEEMSALYRYEVLVKDNSREEQEADMRGYLGRRVHLTVSSRESSKDGSPTTVIQHVAGVIMSIESTTAETTVSKTESWYKWTIRPSLARACYSRNRLVYTRKSLGISENDRESPALAFFRTLCRRWDTDVEMSQKAQDCLESNIRVQLVQNDESDYNFMSRLAAAWGLAFVWEVPEDTGREKLCIFDALSEGKSIARDKTPLPIGNRAAKTRYWTRHYGVQDFQADELKVQFYQDTTKLKTLVRYSAYEQGNILEGKPNREQLKRRVNTLRMALDNRGTCFGAYRHTTSGQSLPTLGRVMHFRPASESDDGGLQYSTETHYLLTRMTIQVAQESWQADVEGTMIDGTETPPICRLPHPVEVNMRATEPSEMLVSGEAYQEPKIRLFVARVVDASPFSHTEGENKVTENTCWVREMASFEGENSEKTTFSNEMLVELGSPFADKNSGILARPREGNVLVCLDCGDFSLPIAITALFRDGNQSPFAELKAMDRHTLEEQNNITDYTALTLRNRVQLPPRDYTKQEENPNGTESRFADNKLAIDGDLLRDSQGEIAAVTRPLSVHELAKGKYPFHQIQLITRDNGVSPVQHNEDITNTYIASDAIGTVVGFLSEADFSSGYAMENFAAAAQKVQEAPTTRPHFEGVNVYSAKDVLLQSADHQIVNAGGEIVITASQGITLRVGRSSIKITEAGIDVMSACGKVSNPGAYPAYNSSEMQEREHLMGLELGCLVGGKLRVDGSGVNSRGSYISNTAFNMFKAQTALGSVFQITDYSAQLFAPKTTVVGGAAAQNTMVGVVTNALFSGIDSKTAFSGLSNLYVDQLQDGHKVYGLSCSDFTGSIAGGVYKTILVVTGVATGLDRFRSIFSLTGSMVQMEPDALTLSGNMVYTYSDKKVEVCTPTAGFLAMTERSTASGALKTVGGLFKKLGEIGAVIGAVGGVLLGCGVGVIASALLNSDKRHGEKDIFTTPFSTTKPTPKCRDFGDAGSKTWASALGAGGGTLLGVLGLIAGKYATNVMDFFSNLLFLYKREVTMGVESVKALRKKVVTLQKQSTAVSEQSTNLQRSDTAVNQNTQAVADRSQEVVATVTTVSRNATWVQSTEEGAQSTATTASTQTVHAIKTTTSGNETNVASVEVNV